MSIIWDEDTKTVPAAPAAPAAAPEPAKLASLFGESTARVKVDEKRIINCRADLNQLVPIDRAPAAPARARPPATPPR